MKRTGCQNDPWNDIFDLLIARYINRRNGIGCNWLLAATQTCPHSSFQFLLSPYFSVCTFQIYSIPGLSLVPLRFPTGKTRKMVYFIFPSLWKNGIKSSIWLHNWIKKALKWAHSPYFPTYKYNVCYPIFNSPNRMKIFLPAGLKIMRSSDIPCDQ